MLANATPYNHQGTILHLNTGTNHILIKSFTLRNKNCILYESPLTYGGRIIFLTNHISSQIIITIATMSFFGTSQDHRFNGIS